MVLLVPTNQQLTLGPICLRSKRSVVRIHSGVPSLESITYKSDKKCAEWKANSPFWRHDDATNESKQTVRSLSESEPIENQGSTQIFEAETQTSPSETSRVNAGPRDFANADFTGGAPSPPPA